MSLDDFMALTPKEFNSAYDNWFQMQESTFKSSWEQARYICFIIAKTVDIKKKINRPEDILKLSWDHPELKNKGLTKEEKEERFRMLVEKWK
jgi:hypothetical protein